MIVVDVDRFSLTATGHAMAERNAEGHDLVCCAVSALLQSLGNYLEEECDEMIERLEYDYDVEEETLTIECIPNEHHAEKIGMLFEMTIKALEDLEKQYPTNLTLI